MAVMMSHLDPKNVSSMKFFVDAELVMLQFGPWVISRDTCTHTNIQHFAKNKKAKSLTHFS